MKNIKKVEIMRCEIALHILFVAAYMGLGIYMQLAYIYSPMDILLGGWGLAVVAFIGAGSLSPIFVMVFDKMTRQEQFRSSCSKFVLFSIVALGCAIQLGFGIYCMVGIGFQSWAIANASVINLMQQWDAYQVGKDIDFFQHYYGCCGTNDDATGWDFFDSRKSWNNIQSFADFAEHFNATAKYPVPDGCLLEYDPKYPYESELDGLFYNETNIDYILQNAGCASPVYDFISFNSFVISIILITVSGTELMILAKSLLCTAPTNTKYLK